MTKEPRSCRSITQSKAPVFISDCFGLFSICTGIYACLYPRFTRRCCPPVLSSMIVLLRIFPFSLIKGRSTALCHEAQEKVVCALVGVRAHVRGSWNSGTKRARFPAPTNPYNIYWNLCHGSDLSIKKKNPNRNLKGRTHSQTQPSLSAFHSANNFCTISHFSTFADYQKGNKNIFYDGRAYSPHRERQQASRAAGSSH